MKRLFSMALIALLAAPAAACNTPDVVSADPDPASVMADPPIRTDREEYRLRTTAAAHELTIGVSYTNPTQGSVYIPTCHTPNPPVLEKWENGRWTVAFSPVVLLCLGPPVVIRAGETYDYTYHVSASRRPNTYPRFEVERIPGAYRLVWSILGTWTADGPEPGLGQPLPLERRVSNTFRIVE